MAEKQHGGRAAVIRPIILLLVVGGIGFAWWRSATHKEGYHGGDVVTTGTIEAVHVRLGFKVSGRIAEVPVTEGQTVLAGDLVGRLESQDLEVMARSARAALEATHASVQQARAARAKAVRDLARVRSLLSSNATTPQQMDAATEAAQSAEAQVQLATAQVHQAESALAQAQLQLSYARLVAPQGGIVSEEIHQPGEMVTVGDPVIALAHLDTVKVHAAVDETRIGAVRPGDRVRLRVYTFDRRTFDGTVIAVQPAGDFATRKDWGAQRRDIRTFTVTAEVPNRDHLLKDGMTAEVTIVPTPGAQKLVGENQ